MAVDIAEFFAKAGLGGDPLTLFLQPFPEGRNERSGAGLPGRKTLTGSAAFDISLDFVEFSDAA